MTAVRTRDQSVNLAALGFKVPENPCRGLLLSEP